MSQLSTSPERSRLMRKVCSKNTTPELRVRRLLHGLGFRYRLHVPTLPGKPDLVFPSRKCVIFVHGCFWHRHENCKRASTPKSNVDYWREKFQRNVERDRRNQDELTALGWQWKIVWECELRDLSKAEAELRDFLDA